LGTGSAQNKRKTCSDVNGEALIGKRDCAILALLVGCGLRRSETAQLTSEHFQRRDDHWAIVDLFGKGGHIRSVPVPDWVKSVIDRWTGAAQIECGSLFRCVTNYGTVWGKRIAEKVIWHVVRKYAMQSPTGQDRASNAACGMSGARAHACVMKQAASGNKSNSYLAISARRQPNSTSAASNASDLL
jgi:site-specific recombinase XerC